MADADKGRRMVYAVLAAQVAALRDRGDAPAAVDLLWQAADIVEQLSTLLAELAMHHPARSAELDARCAAASAAGCDVREALGALAFLQAQRLDIARQTAGCVVTALERMAADDLPPGQRLSATDIAALYVFEDQHTVHASVTRAFGIAELVHPRWGTGNPGMLRAPDE